ncbi:MAG: hydroxysqualene dehydroxylase HpnE, partial [Alcaligenaceae bacterium]|nr:hydroxysqualene dehydroxylase HpnE [Alcaligenaceae bacterium]
MNIAVIGAGWAGLAGALRLHDAGHRCTVLEAAPMVGGRARAIRSTALDTVIDSGQHILLGAYTETLALMDRLGVPARGTLDELALRLESADGRFRLSAGGLPAPWHHLLAIIGAHGLSLADKLCLTRTLVALKRSGWRVPAGMTVGHWLSGYAASAALRRRFWEPLCLATMNTAIDAADAELFANVLRDSLGSDASASRMLIPRGTLSQLWPDAACALLPDVRLGHAARTIQAADTGYLVDGEHFDGMILATPPTIARRLLQGLALPPTQMDWWHAWPDWSFEPISTISLRLTQPWNLKHAMLMLWDRPKRGQFGQWLFNRRPDHPGGPMAHVVISQAGRCAGMPAADLIQGTIAQLRDQVSAPMPDVLAQTVIREKRATFSAVPGLQRPGALTPWPNIVLAGDWTDTGYPAVLEGAVGRARTTPAPLHRKPR